MKDEKLLTLGLCLLWVEIIASQTFTKDVIKTIEIDAEKDCGKQTSCNCTELGICGQTCHSGRIKYPKSRKITLPDARTVHVNSSSVTLKFDIKGDCNNCTFLKMNGENSFIRFSIQGTNLMIDDKIDISVMSFRSLIFRFSSGKGYLENKEANFSIDYISSVSLVSHPTDKINLKEVTVYDDVLTSREIGENKTDQFCRCPATHPEFRNGGCFMINSMSSGRNLLDSNTFYGISEALLDNKSSSKWASTDTDKVTITMKLYEIYQIEKIIMNIDNTLPNTVIWEIFNEGKWTNMVNSGLFTGTINDSIISCTIKSGNENNVLAAGNIIRVTLNGTQQQNDTNQYIISGAGLTAKCACRGISMGCSANSKSYYKTYTCLGCSHENQTNTPPCSSCSKSFILYDGRCGPCTCNMNGTLKCESNGRCTCKIGVTGGSCDQCVERKSNCTPQPCNCELPQITFSPSYGPKSGGTMVTLTGRNINVLPDIFLARTQQVIIFSNSTQITFKTSSGMTGSYDIALRWNESTWGTSAVFRNLSRPMFVYKPDPVLFKNPSKSLLTAAAGCKLRFPGQNLDSVSSPQLTFFIPENLTTKCDVSEKKEVICSMAKLSAPTTIEALLEMECSNCSEKYNVTFVKPNISNSKQNVDYLHPFVKEIIIQGSNFEACEMNEVKITIEKAECTITQFSDSSITCEPPTSAPDDEVVYKIQLKIGDEIFDVGEITYKTLVNSIYFVYIMLGIGAFVLLLVVILITICLWKKRSKDAKTIKWGTSQHEMALPNAYTISNPLNVEPSVESFHDIKPSVESFDDIKRSFLSKLDYSLKSDVEKCLLPVDSFTTNNPAVCIASGDKARMIVGNFAKDNSQIYVKYLKKNLPVGKLFPSYVANVLKECTRFRKLEDSNILTIIGIAVENNKFHILYPYMANRSLKAHVSDENQDFSLKQLTIYSRFVVDGMIYLSENGIYHRDLAARNCMVDRKGSVKISDGSFSFDFYPTEYMLDKAKHKYLPIRWMAPESLSSGFYDSKSDVWAFGVLFWEILTRGCLPFVDTAESQIQQTIEDGYRLGKPDFVTEDIYVLMNTCWEEMSDYRPTFEQLQEQIDDVLGDNPDTSDDYVNVGRSKPSESIYMNSASFKRRNL